ncbi:hypothetical protein NQ117_06640 [Paenibacillus sp. SC116]|uniref:hypothetical protein n=1 Tax=Paenibacillus sp. SC116 TaxID=2968986 RepID=UPI00215AE605|nr:hypothetical protein [Paenibacillus sp. SC116]MCR8843355.1 hypothetical protein [Paenibacillus sp. SC116]
MDELTLNQYRNDGTFVRVVRDFLEINDVKGYVVAWDDETVMIRRRNRRVVKLKRSYFIQRMDEPRQLPPGLLEELD